MDVDDQSTFLFRKTSVNVRYYYYYTYYMSRYYTQNRLNK